MLEKEYGDRYPKAVASLVKDEEKLLSFYDFPAAYWQTIRSTNVIESAFATVRLRQRVTKGAGTRTRGLTLAFQLLAMAEKQWRKTRNPHLVAEALGATKFLDGRSPRTLATSTCSASTSDGTRSIPITSPSTTTSVSSSGVRSRSWRRAWPNW